MEGEVITIKKKRNRTPTIKQVKAIKYINKGNSVRKSLILAGYSIKTADKSTDFFKARGVQNALGTLKQHVLDKGLSTEKIADKFAEWIDATKPFSSNTEPDRNIPDYDTQLKAYDRWKGVMDIGEKKDGKVSRKLTIEEFINEDEVK